MCWKIKNICRIVLHIKTILNASTRGWICIKTLNSELKVIYRNTFVEFVVDSCKLKEK